MLESQALLLRATPASAYGVEDGGCAPFPRTRRVGILDALSGDCLGSVHSAQEPRSWFRWLNPAPWQVFETEDLSLVFTLRRRWRWSRDWVVRDAESRYVGVIVGTADLGMAVSLPVWRIEDSCGRCLARLHEVRGGKTGLFVTPDGAELGFLGCRDDDTELTFAKGATENPFTRMLLLAAALVRG